MPSIDARVSYIGRTLGDAGRPYCYDTSIAYTVEFDGYEHLSIRSFGILARRLRHIYASYEGQDEDEAEIAKNTTRLRTRFALIGEGFIHKWAVDEGMVPVTTRTRDRFKPAGGQGHTTMTDFDRLFVCSCLFRRDLQPGCPAVVGLRVFFVGTVQSSRARIGTHCGGQ